MQSHKLVDSTAEGAVNTLKFKIPHVSLMPESDGGEGDRLSITLEFVPKSDFAGGNNVPFFVDDVMTCIPVGQEEKSGEITFATHCGYVNVPLNFNPAPVNHTPQGLDPETVTHKVSSLYIDNYATVRDDPSADWRYHFIEEIGTHRVYSERDPDTELDPDGTISPDETTRYYVMLTVKAKGVESGRNFYAKLDEPVGEKTFTGISVISILGTGIDTLNENMVVYRKSVDYVDGKYVLKLNVQSDSSGSIIGQSLPKFSAIEYSGDGNSSGGNTTGRQSTVTIPIDGEYTITLKGGNGGNGGSSNLFDTDGGVGGKGGYVSASYFLKKGTVLRFYAGANAQNSTDSRKGGAGGEASYVAVLDSNDKSTVLYYLVIAAGGGGGGGAAIFSRGKTGIEPNSFNINARNDHNTPDSKETSLDGYSGGSGVDGSILFTGGNPGTASANYVYIAPDTDDAEIIHRSSSKITDASATAAGMGTLTCDSVGKSGTGSKDNLYQYTIETAISKYFDVDSISLTEKDVETPLTKNITYMLDPTASASESNREYTKIVTDIRPTVEPLEGQTNIYGVDYTVNIYLTPRAGFLGGNEVELIAAQKALTGMLTGIKLSQDGKDDFINFDEDRALDYVNVEISDSLESEISLEVRDDVYIFGGDPVIKSSLVKSITLPAIGDSSRYTWEDDYLKLIDPRLDNEALTPDHTTDYTITAGYGPLYEEPYTNVRPVSGIEAVTISKIATVHTDARIDFVLTGVTPDGLVADTNGKYSDLVEFSENKYAEKDYTVDLSLVSMGSSHHHHMPNAITVTVGDAPLEAGVGYTYTRHDDDSASVIIYKEYITANVVITVEACHESFTVTYLYQNEPESEDATDFVLDRHFGEPIDLENDFITAGKTLPTVYDHYKFNWYLGGELIDISSIGTMPKRNLVFTGRYDPVEYTITVNYHKPDGTVTTVTQAYPYNTEYSILSEEVEGYIPSIAVINGIATRDETFDVTYTSAAGKLTIIYIYSDNSEASPTYSESLDVGETYSVDSPAIDGYSPAVDTVSGEMTAEGVTVTVVYTANKYKVTFNPDGGSCSVPDRTVEYDNIYGYNADSLTFEALPVPVKLGATFEGWMLNGSDINANSTVKITEDSELVAKWKEIRFTITVNYVTDLGASVSTKSESLAVGASYSYITPEHSGHTPDKLIVSGTMPAQNTSVTVTYNRNSYTVTVEFKTSDGQKLAEPQVLTVLHGDAYSVTAPEVAGYVPNMNVVDGVVNANNVNVTVYYYSESISVDITWGDMDFTYDRGTWDPVTHSYNGGKLAPKSANNNTVTVTNNTQSQDITVGFDFVVSSQYPTITGKYTATNNANAAALGDVTVRKNGKSTTAYFWIDDNGTLGDEALPENFVAGKCVVIIKN